MVTILQNLRTSVKITKVIQIAMLTFSLEKTIQRNLTVDFNIKYMIIGLMI